MKARGTLTERLEFYSIPEPNSGCILWIGTTTKTGYGQLWDGKKIKPTHRITWTLKNGQIPFGLYVLHRGDTPACINPDHLFVGTQKENMDDRDRKGRRNQTRGEAHGNPKLTEDNVRYIRSSGGTLRALAAEFGCCIGTIWHIKHRKKWAHVK